MREPRQQLAALHPPRPLPPQPTTFVGREAEIAALDRLLAEPDCRLVTIVGPGGIGKTRLALQVAAQAAPAYADGIAFVLLQSVDSAASLPAAIAVAVGCPLSGWGEPGAQLLRYLGDKELLLLLDNFEHLLEGAQFVGDLLAAAPRARLLVTSREALNLQEEWRYPLAGLPLPDDGRDGDLERSEAVRLFVERARRVRRDFALDAEYAGVVRICRLVEGLPLAIELAAAWTRTLPCAEIADELARTLALEAPGLRNLPERHRSMRAVFEQSWARLGEEERAVYARLAVFRGGFAREAAERVAGATLPVLATLLDKSLVHYEADGRYHLHELLGEYAAEQLAASPGEVGRVVARHGAYYVEYLERRRAAMAGGGQIEATREIAAELDNVRAAWQRAVRRGDVAAIARAAHPLALFHEFRGRYQEGMAALEQAIERLRVAPPDGAAREVDLALAGMLVDRARLDVQLGELARARAALEESRDRCERHGAPPPPGQMTDPLLWLGVLALLEGRADEAARFAEEAQGRDATDQQPGNRSMSWSLRAVAALWQGRYDAARRYAAAARAAAEAVEDRWHLAYCLIELGLVASAQGNYAEATGHFRAGYAIREEFGDPEGMAVALNGLAEVALLAGDYPAAGQLYERTRATYQELGGRGGLARSLGGLGAVAAATGDDDAAREHFARALRLVAEIRFVQLTLTILASIGAWLLQAGPTGRREWGVELLALVRRHPAGDHATRERARQLLARDETALAPGGFPAALRRGEADDLDVVLARLQATLDAPLPHPAGDAESPAEPAPTQSAPPEQALVELLTERERAVLRLLVAGRSNRQIADELSLSVGTVKWYTGQLYGKLGVESRTQAIARARELRLVD